jgi:acyl-CoA oxidase
MKFGFNNKDNGYLMFDKVRVPRRNLLMRYIKVDKQGAVSLEGDPKIAYSVMLYTRL